LRFSVAPDPDPSPQGFGDKDVRGNYNGLDYMLFHNLYYLLNQVHSTVDGSYPMQHTIGSHEDPMSFADELRPIDVDNLVVGHNLTWVGDISVYAGNPGITITNTTVENNAYFLANAVTNCVAVPSQYLFEPGAYMKTGESNTNPLPPYRITDEFKQVTNPSIMIFPNPNNGIFNIQLTNSGSIGDASVYNNLGQAVYQSKITDRRSSIDLSSQPKGIYFIKVQSADRVYTEKVVVE
jgi:Secretion system C-terminal sorting domain